jgi:hypothetical protein
MPRAPREKKREEERLGVDDALDAVFEKGDVEVDE